jgi:hypothetical protein
MAFLFKSKKNQEKAAAATKADEKGSVAGSQASLHGANGRGSKDEKDGLTLSQTPTPTGSVNNSINSFHGNAPSPDPKGPVRRGTGGLEKSDLPVSCSWIQCRIVDARSLIIADTEPSYEM